VVELPKASALTAGALDIAADSPPTAATRADENHRTHQWHMMGPAAAADADQDVDEGDHMGSHHTDIAPTGGTLVIFDSRVVEHEVLVVGEGSEDRFALTSWVIERTPSNVVAWCRQLLTE